MSTNLESYLNKFTESDWLEAVDTLLPCIHEVDRNAVQIWFRFYPLSLKQFIDAAEDRDATLHGIAMQGDFELKDQIATSHRFFYGHRFWPVVKCKIEKEIEEFKGEDPGLVEVIKTVAILVAEKLKVERPLVNAIVAVGLMTLNQVGLDAFKAASGEVEKPSGIMTKSPNSIVEARATDDSQGMLGFLKTINKKFSVNYIAAFGSGKFPVVSDQEIASASANDRSKNWQEMDSRCWEGPVPVECTAASCGNVLGRSFYRRPRKDGRRQTPRTPPDEGLRLQPARRRQTLHASRLPGPCRRQRNPRHPAVERRLWQKGL